MSSKPDADVNPLSGHRARLRAKLEHDPVGMTDYEVMELLLGLVLPRRDTKILAKLILGEFQGMRGALDARPDELERLPGFGPALLSLWRLLRELMARYAAAPVRERQSLSSPEMVAAIARQRLGHLPHEESWLVLVDAQNRLLGWERLSQGSISSVSIQPRDVLEKALIHKASGIILVHNHPGGNPLPSRSDMELTKELQSLAPRLALRMLDHIIVTSGNCYSISGEKLLRMEGGI